MTSSSLNAPIASRKTAPDDDTDRFEFGKNWAKFLILIDEQRIDQAEHSLLDLLGLQTLAGKTFLDIGSGSGLFSLAAHRLGATVHSFDYDPQSVYCTRQLKNRYAPNATNWHVEQGSVLDTSYMERLGTYDIVYSWGVLHHTGAMWSAIELAASRVSLRGVLYIALYNDQGFLSHAWRVVKRTYNRAPCSLRFLIVWPCFIAIKSVSLVRALRAGHPTKTHYQQSNTRGMSAWRDLIDWVGGYPFEVTLPAPVIEFLAQRSFVLRRLKDCGRSSGCNEFVFERVASPSGRNT